MPAFVLAQGSLTHADWFAIGLVLSIVGGFLLANAILFRHPRTLVQEHFRGSRVQLRSIREYIFHRVQVHLGFVFLLVGFGLQLYGHFRPPPAAAEGQFPTLAIGLILLVLVALEIGGWWLSHALFRRYVREYFLGYPPDFETDMELAREVGTLFGVKSSGEETVESYLERLRLAVGIPDPGRRARRPMAEAEPDEELA